ncbi:hypothetical protein BDEG_23405 [Batrachochytrium dendrobatidis JEL423]|nr:hypothetical protein BDEG_23405 [Batrachochytrium dendrobatidis JEL423]
MSELFRAISPRLRENNWIVVFKTLTLIHVLIKEGDSNRVMGYLSSNTDKLSTAGFRDKSGHPMGTIQSKNIDTYSNYLQERVSVFKAVKIDWISEKDTAIAKFRTLQIKDGLLEDISLLQRHIDALLKCSWYVEDLDQVVTLQAFRLLTWDMMSLFHLLNEAVLRILGSYFEMERQNAAKALEIYKKFSVQTKKTLEFFETGRKVRRETGVDVPIFHHPPLMLAASLEEYLRAPDFEEKRAEYKQRRLEKEKSDRTAPQSSTNTASASKDSTQTKPEKKDVQLIDFFSSVDQEMSAFSTAQSQAQYPAANFDAFWDPNDGFSQRANADRFGNQSGAVMSSDNPFLTVQHNQQLLQQQLQESDMLLRSTVLGQQQQALGMQQPSVANTQASGNAFYMNPGMQGSASSYTPQPNHPLSVSAYNPFLPAAPASPAPVNTFTAFGDMGQMQASSMVSSATPKLDPFSQLGNMAPKLPLMDTNTNIGVSPYATNNPFGRNMSQPELPINPTNPFGVAGFGRGSMYQQPIAAQSTGGFATHNTTGNSGASTAYNPFAGLGLPQFGGMQGVNTPNSPMAMRAGGDVESRDQAIRFAATSTALLLPPQSIPVSNTIPHSMNYSVGVVSGTGGNSFANASTGAFQVHASNHNSILGVPQIGSGLHGMSTGISGNAPFGAMAGTGTDSQGINAMNPFARQGTPGLQVPGQTAAFMTPHLTGHSIMSSATTSTTMHNPFATGALNGGPSSISLSQQPSQQQQKMLGMQQEFQTSRGF